MSLVRPLRDPLGALFFSLPLPDEGWGVRGVAVWVEDVDSEDVDRAGEAARVEAGEASSIVGEDVFANLEFRTSKLSCNIVRKVCFIFCDRQAPLD